MKTKPIIFSAPMIRALLREIERPGSGKTMTRRVVKCGYPIADLATPDEWNRKRAHPDMPPFEQWGPRSGRALLRFANGIIAAVQCPYGRPGDLLWVRERHQLVTAGEIREGYGEVRSGVMYDGENSPVWSRHTTKIYDLTGQPNSGPMQFKPRPWRPSIFMPRWASRITLLLTDVRVERVQDISEEDARAEGVEFGNVTDPATGEIDRDAPEAFEALWDSINGKRPGCSWDDNPFTWCLTFKPILANVDAVLAEPGRFGVAA